VVAGVALALRGLYLAQASDAPLFDMLLMDGAAYKAWGSRIAAGDWLGSEVFYQAPLYPYFLALIELVFGDGLGAIRAVQALLGALSCGLLFLAGAWFFSRRIGWIAGLALAFYPPALFFDGLIQKASLGGVLVTALLALLGRARHAPSRTLWLAVGATLGALMATREETVLLVPVVLAASFLLSRGRAHVPSCVAATLGGLALVLAPIAARNAHVGGEFVLTTSQAGTNFYIGNHEGARGVYEPLLPGRGNTAFERNDARELAEQAEGRPLTPNEVSSHWFGRSFEWIAAHPGAWAALLARKFALALNAYEIPDYEDQDYYAEHSGLLRWLAYLLHLGVVAPLAAAGVYLCWPQRREFAVLLALGAVLLLGVTLFYVFARYRYPLAPIALLFAAAAVVRVREAWLAGERAKLARAGLAAVLVAVLSNWPLVDRRAQLAMSLSNAGAALIDAGRGAQALDALRRSVELADDADNRANLSTALLAANQPREALTHAQKALALRRDDPELLRRLAAAQLASGDERAGIDTLKQAIQLRPNEFATWEQLVGVFVARGDWMRAIETARNAARYNPGEIAAGLQLAWLLSSAEDRSLRAPAEAVEIALQLDRNTRGEDLRVLDMLGATLMSAGREQEAQEVFERTAKRAEALGQLEFAERVRATAAALREPSLRAGAPQR
jgi:4-amino-4-deoxy-L-arabinose transferase-like glycosyltransferase/Tfp pilus assembly protein PilF